ncbi:hypothetical protein CEXT_229811 [Caerostris extrusa]|uniref:Uncharacterized protein n=1 Tax=Caerostris extrusa TaxID=172846 RepID=A0AAV4MNN7_CAEEX|nr:hypothetical protein CEXT_229811 [Caerostris extrusa]
MFLREKQDKKESFKHFCHHTTDSNGRSAFRFKPDMMGTMQSIIFKCLGKLWNRCRTVLGMGLCDMSQHFELRGGVENGKTCH